MKTFSNKEKWIINYIVSQRDEKKFVLANVFNQWFDQTGLSFDFSTGLLRYDFRRDANMVDRILQDEHDIIEIALLVKFLETHQYIYIIRDGDRGNITLNRLKSNFGELGITYELPRDITEVIRKTLYRVFVSQSLVTLVENDFQSEERLQLTIAVSQLQQAQEQLKVSQEQVDSVKGQTKELQKQTKEIEEQTRNVQKQSEEAKNQTNYAQKQSEQAQMQTKYARNTLWVSIAALLLSPLISIILSKCSRDEEQRDLMLYKMDSINSILSNSTESIQIQFDDFNDIGKHVTKQNDSIIHIEEKQTKILRQIDKNVKNIDNNN